MLLAGCCRHLTLLPHQLWRERTSDDMLAAALERMPYLQVYVPAAWLFYAPRAVPPCMAQNQNSRRGTDNQCCRCLLHLLYHWSAADVRNLRL
jgi:hypothetical protein